MVETREEKILIETILDKYKLTDRELLVGVVYCCGYGGESFYYARERVIKNRGYDGYIKLIKSLKK